MSLENPTPSTPRNYDREFTLYDLYLCGQLLRLAEGRAAETPGWQSTFENLRRSVDAVASDFNRWCDEQEKGGAK